MGPGSRHRPDGPHDGIACLPRRRTGGGGEVHDRGQRPGRVFSRYELANRARGCEYEGCERTIDSRIRNLRQKIETDPMPPSSSTP